MTFAEKYGPWAVITGASEGTGRSFARQIAAQGVNCILFARRAGPLVALAEDIQTEFGIECITACVDLAAVDATEQIIAAVGPREVGLFISNAGADSVNSRFLDVDAQAWTDLVNRNVTTVVQSSHHFAAPMRARGHGGILLVNSGACYGGSSFMAVYCATKAFMLCFAEGLWGELHKSGVDVLTLVMGKTDTPAFRDSVAKKGLPFPTDVASADDVAAMGLSRLPHGPVHNWGAEDDEKGFALNSAADRRARVLAIDEITKSIFGKD